MKPSSSASPPTSPAKSPATSVSPAPMMKRSRGGNIIHSIQRRPLQRPSLCAPVCNATSDGGKTEAAGDGLTFSGNSVTIILTAATDYALDPAKNFRNGMDPAQTAPKQAATAAAEVIRQHSALTTSQISGNSWAASISTSARRRRQIHHRTPRCLQEGREGPASRSADVPIRPLSAHLQLPRFPSRQSARAVERQKQTRLVSRTTTPTSTSR